MSEKFEPNKHMMKVQGGRDYLPVAARLVWFRQEHPDWGVSTRCDHLDVAEGVAVFHCTICNENGQLRAEGTKCETRKGFADFIEKAETGAIGRALAVCGFGTQFAPELDEGDRLADSPQAAKSVPTQPKGESVPTAPICPSCKQPQMVQAKRIFMEQHGVCPDCKRKENGHE